MQVRLNFTTWFLRRVQVFLGLVMAFAALDGLWSWIIYGSCAITLILIEIGIRRRPVCKMRLKPTDLAYYNKPSVGEN